MRSYYKSEWHCDCRPEDHTLERQIQGLKNVFHTEDVSHSEGFIHVRTDDSCVLASSIFNAEFHDLVLSSIHSSKKGNFTQLTFLFEWKTVEASG